MKEGIAEPVTHRWISTVFESDEISWPLTDELRSIKTSIGQDPDENFLRAEPLGSDTAAHKEPMTDRQRKGIITNGITDEYPDVLFTIRRDPNFRDSPHDIDD